MDYIRNNASVLCVLLVISEILIFVLPKGNIRKTAEIVFSLFLIISFVNIFIVNPDFNSYEMKDYSLDLYDYEEDFNDYLIVNSKEITEKIINDELQTVCLDDFTVETQWVVAESNVCLKNITIWVKITDISKINVIKNKVASIAGVVPEVKSL